MSAGAVPEWWYLGESASERPSSRKDGRMQAGEYVVVCTAEDLPSVQQFWAGDNPRTRAAYLVVSVSPGETGPAYGAQAPTDVVDVRLKPA